MTRTLLYLLALVAVTLIIWQWNRGAQRRRFRRAFPATPDPSWVPEDTPFLAAFERAFALRRGWAHRLPPAVTPMAVYLTLYPTHCVYDENEPTRLLRALRARLGDTLPPDPLTVPLGELATRWRAAPEAASERNRP